MNPIVFGMWPLAGITTVGVTERDAEETMAAAIDAGITRFDTAFSYGYDGESDRLLGRFIRSRRDRFQVIGKVGQRWTADRKRVIDGRPATLIADAETSLQRIGIERFDLLMLHSPDPDVPIEESAQAISQLQQRGLCDTVGVCNVTSEQLCQFVQGAPCAAIQCPLNLLQQQSLEDLIPECQHQGIDVYVYWTLMKGLLAGRITRDHQFAEGDSRPGYEIFQGEARRRAHDTLDAMQPIAAAHSMTIAQLSISWAASQPGVTGALVGARTAKQVREIAGAKRLPSQVVAQIDAL